MEENEARNDATCNGGAVSKSNLENKRAKKAYERKYTGGLLEFIRPTLGVNCTPKANKRNSYKVGSNCWKTLSWPISMILKYVTKGDILNNFVL